MRKPSATSDRSRAAFTLALTLRASSLLSNSYMASIHDSPTCVSRMIVANSGGMQRSTSKFDRGFSILYNAPVFKVNSVRGARIHTLRLFSRLSMSLLLS